MVKMPVLRFYGQTKRGQKACINVFDYFPYFFAELPKVVFDPLKDKNHDKFLGYFAQCLELAIYIVQKNIREAKFEIIQEIQAEIMKSETQYVHNVEIVYKYPIYGYNKDKKPFLKIELYDPWSVKTASNILREGCVFGVSMQPYEAHISWHMHFFGDYCLGGNEYIKVSEFKVRKFPKLDKQKLAAKSFYPDIFKRQQNQEEDFSFLQNVPDLKIWHDEMPFEKSPYERQTYMEIEIDANCLDILNQLEKPGELSQILDTEKYTKSQVSDDLPVINMPDFNQLHKKSYSIEKKEQPIDTHQIQQAFRYRYNRPQFFNKLHDSQLIQNLNKRRTFIQQPDFEESQISIARNSSFDQDRFEKEKIFAEYSKDIKEVRSLVNLWREEFDRRIQTGAQLMEKVKKLDAQRKGGYTQSLVEKMPSIRSQLEKHLKNGVGKEIEPQIESQYEQMASIDFNSLYLVINTKNKPNGEMERWELLGMHSMKHFQEHRYQLAIEKGLEQEIEESESEDLDTLDVMKSLKNQFANIKQRQLDQSKRSRSKDYMVKSNMRITDFIQSKSKSQERCFDEFQGDFSPNLTNNERQMLSQVKELSDDEQDLSFLTQGQFLSSHKKEQQTPEIHYLHGDKITKYPGKKFEKFPGFVEHRKAFYSNKEDLHLHLSYVSFTHQRKIQTKDLNIEFDQLNSKIDFNQKEFRCKVKGPKSSKINQKYFQEPPKKETFISPATQFYLNQQSPVFIQTLEISKNKLIQKLDRQFQDEINGGTVMALELFLPCISSPNWLNDPIAAVFMLIHNESAQISEKAYKKVKILILNKKVCAVKPPIFGIRNSIDQYFYAKDEFQLFSLLIGVFREHDPDIIMGWETETLSIGYLCKRSETLGFKVRDFISRESKTFQQFNEGYYRKRWFEQGLQQQNNSLPGFASKNVVRGLEQNAAIPEVIKGRVIINIWRQMRSELQLTNYSLENVSFHVLKKRLATLTNETLKSWWEKWPYLTIDHIFVQLSTSFEIMDQLDLIDRDMNMAKVYGIDYESVMTRGSQFRVEAILSKISKSCDYLLLSASPQQVKDQNQLEVIPLVIEPDKQFYTDPVVVVDFQSLYPSLIISYNLCYSTCLGKIEQSDTDRKLGVYRISPNIKTFFGHPVNHCLTPEESQHIFDSIIIAPNLNCFVKPSIKQGLLPTMLREILSTRIMVKSSLKLHPKTSKTYKNLYSRQLALKLIANVTYGYTAAGFSGRMPSVELADSVVSLGRTTLESALSKVNHQEPTIGTKVIYGDTDSLFILCQGASLSQSFSIGQDIANYVTECNPFPMELKFEKVYFPCVTLAKKRYAGWMYENEEEEGHMEAKGIEVVRRDNVHKLKEMQERCLSILFQKRDLSRVKEYLEEEWGKICAGQIEMKDFVFAKEVRMRNYTNLPNGAVLASRQKSQDPGYILKDGERIQYLIVDGQECGTKKKTQKDLAVSPQEFVESGGVLQLNSEYYIRKVINPALNRIFLAIFGINVDIWFDKMPKKISQKYVANNQSKNKGLTGSKSMALLNNQSSTLNKFYKRNVCLACNNISSSDLCKNCLLHPHLSSFILEKKWSLALQDLQIFSQICQKCVSSDRGPLLPRDIEEVPCVSYHCRIFYERQRAKDKFQQIDL